MFLYLFMYIYLSIYLPTYYLSIYKSEQNLWTTLAGAGHGTGTFHPSISAACVFAGPSRGEQKFLVSIWRWVSEPGPSHRFSFEKIESLQFLGNIKLLRCPWKELLTTVALPSCSGASVHGVGPRWTKLSKFWRIRRSAKPMTCEASAERGVNTRSKTKATA